MADAIYCDPNRRHDFVLLFDVTDGNPNGDPDAGNFPRVDPDTMQGLVTDVAIKRKVRDWIHAVRHNADPFEIYVQSGGPALNAIHRRAYEAKALKSTGTRQSRKDVDQARGWMCATFYDIRMFGAVMTTGVNCGQVRGPIQLTFARSIDPIQPLDLSITRVAVTKEEDAEVVVSEDTGQGTSGKQTEMGRKALVPYGLYLSHGFFNPHFAADTGATDQDLDLFWRALENMWDLDRSSSRGLMACRGLYVFSHDSDLGNAPANKLFDLIKVPPSKSDAPRSFADYEVIVDEAAVPAGVTLTRLV
jgi:CRISPR-associated protein Csd2